MKDQLINYTLHLADNSLIMGHRLSEWSSHAPMLEQDIALSNIALDLIGQSRNFYQYAALLQGGGATEDTLAYLRDPNEFRNLLIAELPNGDWANTVLKLYFFSLYQYLLYERLVNSKDEQLAAIAEKSLKEVTYHVRWSSEWVIRLGDGTTESHSRMEKALNELWDYTMEMFEPGNFETFLWGDEISENVAELQHEWNKKTNVVLAEATISVPSYHIAHTGGKEGRHSESLTDLLKEMQYLQRTYPGCEW
jgi:ring-1,2-phenylacetyl-CoA epoxidase subunit PaaC